MKMSDYAVQLVKSTGVLPAIKLKERVDLMPYIQALREGGARVIEITMTTPSALDNFRAIKERFGDDVLLAAGTVLDATTARLAILGGASVIVSPVIKPEIIATALRYGVACFSGAFTPSECLTALEHGVQMVKIFPAALGGPKYMTNLRMVFPEINLIPSGGITLENAADFIRCGACAVSGARNFVNHEMIGKYGFGWVSEQTEKFITIVAQAKREMSPLP